MQRKPDEPLFQRRVDAQLAGAGQDSILEIELGRRLDAGVGPGAVGVVVLMEDGGAHAVAAQLTIEDEDVDLEALVGGFRRRVPVGDDDTAKGIGRGERHEGERVERGAREERVDAEDRKSTRLNSSHEWISYAVF